MEKPRGSLHENLSGLAILGHAGSVSAAEPIAGLANLSISIQVNPT